MNEIENNVSKSKPMSFDVFSLISDKYSVDEFQQQKVCIENLENKLFVVENHKYLNILNDWYVFFLNLIDNFYLFF